jgi:hypothetical protein
MYDAKITQLIQLFSIFLPKKHNFTVSIFNFAKVLLEDVVEKFISFFSDYALIPIYKRQIGI